jgi:AcrR family transcriptional regulator
MGVKERRERERTEVREKILDAALEVFASKGDDGVTMRALADAIEYSPPVIYSHFRDKDAIIRELCYRAMRSLAHSFVAIGSIDDPVERLRRIGRSYVDFALENPSHFRFMFLTPHPLPPDAQDDALKGDPQQDAYAFLKQTVEAGLAAGCFHPDLTDAEEIAQICWAAAHGVVALQNVKQHDRWIEWRDARTSAYRLIDATIAGLTNSDAVGRLTSVRAGGSTVVSKRSTRR